MNLQTAEGLPNPAPLFAKLSRETEKNKDERRQQRDEGHTAGDPSPKNRPGKGTGNGEDLSRKKERLDREDEETRVLLASTTGISNPGSFVAGKIQILDRASLEKMSDEAIIQRILDLQTLLTDLTYQVEAARSSNCSLQRENDDLRETLLSLRAQTEEAKRNRAYASNSNSGASTNNSASASSHSDRTSDGHQKHTPDGGMNKENSSADKNGSDPAWGCGGRGPHQGLSDNTSAQSNSRKLVGELPPGSVTSGGKGGGASTAVKAFAAAEGL